MMFQVSLQKFQNLKSNLAFWGFVRTFHQIKNKSYVLQV
jgi:hypothetical protein